MHLLSRLNKLSLATGVSPDELLLKVIETMEKSLASTPETISNTDTLPKRKRRRHSGWSPSARKHHSQLMKSIWAKKKEVSQPTKRGIKELTPEHKAKLQAGYHRYRVQRKLAAANA